MADNDPFALLPQGFQAAFREFVQQLATFAGDDLLSVAAFGGWLAHDPFYQGTPARSVVMLRRLDVRWLARLAAEGPRHGRRGLHPPLIMTPEQMAASCDVFPLELLEIQYAHVVLRGAEPFADLYLKPPDVRLQCEREVRSQLIHLQQGLLAAGRRHRHLAELCRAEAERAVRVLRGALYLTGRPLPKLAVELAADAAACAGLPLRQLGGVLAGQRVLDLAAFEGFYNDLFALARWLDQWHDRPARDIACAPPAG